MKTIKSFLATVVLSIIFGAAMFVMVIYWGEIVGLILGIILSVWGLNRIVNILKQ